MPYGKKSMGKASPSKAFREPGKTNYGKSANVRESDAKTFSSGSKKGKSTSMPYS